MRHLLPAILLLTMLLPMAQAAMPYPTLTTGDRWEYDARWTDRDGSQFRDRNALIVEGRETVEVGNATYDAYRMRKISLRLIPSGNVISSTNTTEWHRVSDGALLRIDGVRDQAGRPTQTLTGNYSEPCLMVAYPLEVNKTWRNACTFLMEGPDGITERKEVHEGHVARMENITTAVGNFTTYLVEMPSVVGIGHDLVWYSPEGCGRVRLGADHPGSANTDVSAIRCQATGVDSHPIREKEEEKGTPGPAFVLVVAALGAAALVARRRSKRS